MLSLEEHIFIIISYSLYSKSNLYLLLFNLHLTVRNPVWANVIGVLVTPSGINDTFIAGCATLGAFLPAPLFTSIGWNNTNALSLLLCFTGLIVCWGAVSSQQGKTVKKASER